MRATAQAILNVILSGLSSKLGTATAHAMNPMMPSTLSSGVAPKRLVMESSFTAQSLGPSPTDPYAPAAFLRGWAPVAPRLRS